MMEESISLEETNKIRISLGLKPLTDDKTPTKTEDQLAEENFKKHREKEKQERENRRIAEKIAKVKNKRELNSSLKGATLGDPDHNDDDTLKWIKRSRKKEKELAKKRLEELSKMDEAFLADYSEKDLVGLKVAHDMDQLVEGEEQILTLKDSRILDNEEDELQNVEMAEHERTRKNNELKIKKRDYTGYDDDEFTPGNEGMKRKLLAKYDDELEGGTETGFRLGAAVLKKEIAPVGSTEGLTVTVNKSLLNIDYLKNNEMSDYLQEGDRGFKKPKTKKKRPTRRVPYDDDSTAAPQTNGEAMAIDEKTPPKRDVDLNVNFVDDEELQAALARQRRAKMKERRALKPEDIARKVMEEKENRTNGDNDIVLPKEELVAEGEGLVFDDTSEFVRSIVYDQESTKQIVKLPVRKEDLIDESSPIPEKEDPEAGEIDMKEEEDEEAALHAIQMDIDTSGTVEVKREADAEIGTSSEQTYGSGMANTLAILRQQGILKPASEGERIREQTQRERDKWLAEHRATEILLEQERVRVRAQGVQTREYDNRKREQMEQRIMSESFKNYKPDVNIVYHDEFGRELTPKEAWKALSHRFHGKGSGKAKTEKRLKRIADEKKKEAMVSGDTPSNMNRAFQARQEKAGQAHMVLSVGNRGAAPQVAEFLDTPQLSKNKADKKGKKKEQVGTDLSEASRGSRGGTGTPGPQGATISAPPTTMSPTPMMKPSFARITTSSEPVSGIPTPTERTKLSIGLKRKANGDVGPDAKRR